MTQRSEVVSETLRATPPVAAVGVMTVGGLSLSDWVMIATLIYIVLQIAYLLFRWTRLASQPTKAINPESGE
jgi:hypothetical protein